MKRPLFFAAAGTAAFILPILVGAGPGVALSQSKEASRPKFEVASIKPNPSGDIRTTRVTPLPASGTYTAVNQSVSQLVRQAYGLKVFQLEGGPKWIGDFSS